MARRDAGGASLTLGQMQTLVSQRLNEAAGAVFYPVAEIAAALNEANRLLCLMTFCVERTASWATTANGVFYRMVPIFADWLAPLRIQTPDGAKVRPTRLSGLWAIDAQWPVVAGFPRRYAAMGGDLVAIYPHSAVALTVRYAAAPAALVNSSDVPEAPFDYHEILVKYAIYRMRMAEGAAELEQALPLLGEFFDGAALLAAWVKERNVGSGYDTLPPELAGFDRSRLIPSPKKRP
jgi:hypothetical protein